MLTLEVPVCFVLLTDLDVYTQGQINASLREETDSKAAVGLLKPNSVASLLSGS